MNNTPHRILMDRVLKHWIFSNNPFWDIDIGFISYMDMVYHYWDIDGWIPQ